MNLVPSDIRLIKVEASGHGANTSMKERSVVSMCPCERRNFSN